jgi:hypothetical protein
MDAVFSTETMSARQPLDAADSILLDAAIAHLELVGDRLALELPLFLDLPSVIPDNHSHLPDIYGLRLPTLVSWPELGYGVCRVERVSSIIPGTAQNRVPVPHELRVAV